MRYTNEHPRRLCIAAFIGTWMLLSTTAIADDVSPSALLEKGIYTEETVGDLSEAIQIYEKVVSAGEAGKRAAAQAQYRIGVCYQKQGKTEKATQAFKTVIDQFPNESELVQQARSHLPKSPELLPVPWGEGDELHLEMKVQNGLGIGLQIYRVANATEDGQPVWKCDTWQAITANGQLSKSQVIADKGSFAPIKSRWNHSLLGEAVASYERNQVTINMVSKDDDTTLKYQQMHFDNEQCAEVFRRLPLKVGFKTSLNIVSPLGASMVTIGLEVPKIETIEVPAGKFECFRLQLNIGQTFFISNDEHRYIVRFEAGGVSADLTTIRSKVEPERSDIKTDRFALTLPPDWFAYTPSNSNNPGKSHTFLIDPAGRINSSIEAGLIEDLNTEHESVIEWAKAAIEEKSKRTKGFKLGDAGVQSVQLGDREAATAEFEFVDGTRPMKAKGFAVFGDSSAINIRFTTSAEGYESTQQVIDEIVSSLVVE